jgi:HAD superfamily hydrolase (TIGR01509 family)
MTPQELMRRRTTPLRLVIFDCDGVLVDSESLSNRLVSSELAKLGWVLTPEQANEAFLGMTLTNMVPMIEAQIGRAVPAGWKQMIMARLLEVMAAEAIPIPGAVEALRGVSRLGLPWRVASNSSHEEMQVKFGRIGISDLVAGRVHSHRDVNKAKPAPDLFLAAAAAEGVLPAECVVVEDSATGARAAAAAAMDCLGYAPHSDGAALRAFGAVPFGSMLELPGLLELAGVAV